MSKLATLSKMISFCEKLRKRNFTTLDITEGLAEELGYQTKGGLCGQISDLAKKNDLFSVSFVGGRKNYRFLDEIWGQVFPSREGVIIDKVCDVIKEEVKKSNRVSSLRFIEFLNFSLDFLNSFKWVYEQCCISRGEDGRVLIERWHIPVKTESSDKKEKEKEENKKRNIFVQRMSELGAIQVAGVACYLVREKVSELNARILRESNDKLFVHLNYLQQSILEVQNLTKILQEKVLKYESLREYDWSVATLKSKADFSQLQLEIDELREEAKNLRELDSLVDEYLVFWDWMQLDELAKKSLRSFLV